jgi:hypothetical protein
MVGPGSVTDVCVGKCGDGQVGRCVRSVEVEDVAVTQPLPAQQSN